MLNADKPAFNNRKSRLRRICVAVARGVLVAAVVKYILPLDFGLKDKLAVSPN